MQRTTLMLIVALTAGFSACSKEQTIEPEQPPELKAVINNLMPNGGGSGATDWIDNNNNGVGDGWELWFGQSNIGSDGEWQSNYQRVETGIGQFCLNSSRLPGNGSSYYVLNFHYRSNTRIWVAVQYTGRCSHVVIILQPTSKITEVTVRFWAPVVWGIRWYNSPVYPGFLELDEVNVY